MSREGDTEQKASVRTERGLRCFGPEVRRPITGRMPARS